MARELTQDERDELTPGELAAIMGEPTEEAAAAALAEAEAATTSEDRAAERASDAEGDTAEETKPADTTQAAATGAQQSDGAQAQPTADELQAVIAEADAKPTPAAPAPVTYKGISEADYKGEIDKLNTQRAEAFEKVMAGDLDPKEFAKLDAEIAEKRDTLVTSRTLASANEQAAAQRQEDVVRGLSAEAMALGERCKGQAVDYVADDLARVQFDRAMQLVLSSSDPQTTPPKDIVDQAHRIVLAHRGVSAPPAAPAPAAAAPAPAPATRRDVPVTLGGLPAAAPNAVGSDLRAQFAQLSGEEAEEFLERLPASQRSALMAGGMV